MDRANIFAEVEKERDYQDAQWGSEFDSKNTPNDWIAYIALHAGRAVTMPWDGTAFRTAVLKVMALCCRILELDDYAPRHYDSESRLPK